MPSSLSPSTPPASKESIKIGASAADDAPASFHLTEPSFLASLMLKKEIGADRFLESHPEFDGRGVLIAIFGTPSLDLNFPSKTRIPKSPISALSTSSPSSASSGDPFGLIPEQRTRIDINKALAKSKRNRRICTERTEKAKAEGMHHVNLEDLLVEESWLDALPGELQKPYVKSLFRFVECEMRGSAPIYPPPHFIFNALNSTPFDRVKAVIIGQDPYHGPGQATGFAFSVLEGVKIPSSLVNILKELQSDVGCSIPASGNLENWIAHGVLLLNVVLTVRNI